MLLDRRKVKFWQKIVFSIMALLMVVFLGGTAVYRAGCGASSSTTSTDALSKEITRKVAVLAKDPKDAALWRGLGDNYATRAATESSDSAARKADYVKAAAAYRKSAALLEKKKGKDAKETRLSTLEDLARIYIFLKDYEAATGVYGELTAMKPNDAEYFYYMGSTAINAGDTHTAMLALTRYLELDPDSEDAAAVRDWIKANSTSSTPSPASTEGGQ